MEVIGDFVFFLQGRKLYSLEISTSKVKVHLSHNEEITCLAQSSNTLFSGSLDGYILKWSFPSIVSFKISAPVLMMCASPTDLYFLKSTALVLYRLDLSSDSYSPTPLFRGLLSNAVDIKFSHNYTNLVLLQKNSLSILNILTQNVRNYNHNAPLSVLAIHPSSKYIAIGDYTGQIIKIYDKNLTKVHWHSHKVNSIAFTNDENFMISGGQEGVVVLWHESSNEKTFLPRLGCTIKNVAVSEESDMYIVQQTDGSIKVFRTSDYKQVFLYQPLICPGKVLFGLLIETGLVWKDNKVILTASPGSLQVFDPQTSLVQVIDCESRNPLIRSSESYPNPLIVTSVAFTKDFMCTIQTSCSNYMTIKHLKFWKDNQIITLVMHPQDSTSHSIVVFNSDFVTLGLNSFVLWRFDATKWVGGAERSHSGLKCIAGASNTTDLFIVFGHIITQWDNKLSCVREIYEPTNKDFKHLQTINENLLAATSETLYVINDGIILWSLELAFIHGLVSNNNLFIIALNASKYTPSDLRKKITNIILKFEVKKTTPIKIYKVSNPLSFSIDPKGDVVIIDKFGEFQNLDSHIPSESESIPIYEKKPVAEVKPKTKPLIFRYQEKCKHAWLDNLPSHDLPDVDSFFTNIVEALNEEIH